MPLSQRGEFLEQIKNTYYHVLKAFERYVGMSQECLQVLEELSSMAESSQVVLQRNLKMDRASINRHVKQLEGQGLVSRHTDPNDNRYSQVSITKAGSRRLADLLPKRDEFEELVMPGMDDQAYAELEVFLWHVQSNIRRLPATQKLPFED